MTAALLAHNAKILDTCEDCLATHICSANFVEFWLTSLKLHQIKCLLVWLSNIYSCSQDEGFLWDLTQDMDMENTVNKISCGTSVSNWAFQRHGFYKQKFKMSATTMLNSTGSRYARKFWCRMTSYVYTPNLVQTSLTVPEIMGCLEIYASGSSKAYMRTFWTINEDWRWPIFGH